MIHQIIFLLQAFTNVLAAYLLLSFSKRIKILENEKQERVNYLTDPEVIDAELERSARRREAYDSKMTYPPREDSGPPAQIRNPARAPSYRSNGLKFRKRGPWLGGSSKIQ